MYNLKEARNVLLALKAEYDAIPYPKYLHAELPVLEGAFERLSGISEVMKDDPVFIKLKGSLLQTIKRCKLKGTWTNISERGINKAILPVLKKRGHEINFPYNLESKDGRRCCINSYWGARNYMVMDVLGYMFLLKTGGNRLPKYPEPIFPNMESIQRREKELDKLATNILTTTECFLPNSKDNSYFIRFNDSHFRKFTGLDITSNDILNLLLETSRVEFQLDFPVMMMKRSKTKDVFEQKYYEMTVFSRPYEMGYVNTDVRKDGIVQGRTYEVYFNTIFGELFAHNLLTRNYDMVSNHLYNLPASAQIFYRHFLLHHNFTHIEIYFDTIKSRMDLKDKNKTNLINSLERNTFEPLKRNGLILDYEPNPNGLKGLKYIFTLPNKKKKSADQITEGSGVSKKRIGGE